MEEPNRKRRHRMLWLIYFICNTFLLVTVAIIIGIGYHKLNGIRSLVNKVQDFFGDAWDEAEDVASLVMGKINGLFSGNSSEIKGRITTWAKDVADEVVQGPKKTIEELRQAIDKLAGVVDKGKETIGDLNPFNKRHSNNTVGVSPASTSGSSQTRHLIHWEILIISVGIVVACIVE